MRDESPSRLSSGSQDHGSSRTHEPSSALVVIKDADHSAGSHGGASVERSASPVRSSSPDSGSHVASTVTPAHKSEHHGNPDHFITEFCVGIPEKHFSVQTQLLLRASAHFAAMTDSPANPQPHHRLSGPFFFPDMDEFAFSHFLHWLHGYELHGPNDFHSMNHYVGLYILARQFEIEALKNTTMDLIRQYYHRENMTAPAFRLEYLYAHTDGPCLMREFLVSTAAYRALTDAEQHSDGLSESIKGVLRKSSDLAPDFANALCTLARNGKHDVRKGDPCRWHEHVVTHPCKRWDGPEPFESS